MPERQSPQAALNDQAPSAQTVIAKSPAAKPEGVKPAAVKAPAVDKLPSASLVEPAAVTAAMAKTAPAGFSAPAQEAAPNPAPARESAPVAAPAQEAAPIATPAPVAAPEPERRPVMPAEGERRPNVNDRNPPRIPSKAENFVAGDHVVYPTHGVGKVERIAVEEIAGHSLELIHITFEENRMTLRVPVAKARSAGLRKLASRKMFDDALTVLKGRARIKRTMWSRRAQEYEAKINSGDPLAIAEVVRDLHRNAGQPDQSFSERQIYEAAMDRLAAELGALDKTDKATAATKLLDFLKTVV